MSIEDVENVHLTEVHNKYFEPTFKYYKISLYNKLFKFGLTDVKIFGEIENNPYCEGQKLIKWGIPEEDKGVIKAIELIIKEKLVKKEKIGEIKEVYSGINERNRTLDTKVKDRNSLKISKKYYSLDELDLEDEYNVWIALDGISWDSEKAKVTFYYSTREIIALS